MYTNGDIDAAKEALDDMPPRAEEELDPVGNVELMSMAQLSLFYYYKLKSGVLIT